MKHSVLWMTFFAIGLLTFGDTPTAQGRGGRGGNMARTGGRSIPRANINRGPTMSRAGRAGGRGSIPAAVQGRGQAGRAGEGRSVVGGVPSRAGAADPRRNFRPSDRDVDNFLNLKGADGQKARHTGEALQRESSRGGGKRPGTVDRKQGQAWQKRGDEVRKEGRSNYPRADFWKDHPDWARWRWTHPYRWAAWAPLTAWFGWGAVANPYYYDYGGTTYYENGSVYQNGQSVATEQEYADQASQLAETGLEQPDDGSVAGDDEWMPLGVFAMVHQDQGDPIMYFQLAVRKNGVIGGTYHNTMTDQTLPVHGSVDRDTERAAWAVGDKNQPVVETGIYNLTLDQTPVLVHFVNGKTQEWLLVRMDNPKGKEDS